MTLSRYEHTGAAAATGLATGITSAATSFTVISGTGYPTGSVGNFVICIDANTSAEEKILCSARSGTSFTVATGGRGYDGTTAASHSAGTVNVTHVLSAAEIDDDNSHIYDTTRNDHTQYVEGSATPGGDLAGSGSTYSVPVLKTSGVTAGTYTNATVTFDAKGRATSASSGASTGVIGFTSYNPSTATTHTVSSTTLAAVDSTNLTVSFTAPSSGNVLVRLNAVAAGGSGYESYWALFTHSTTTQQGLTFGLGTLANATRVTAPIEVTGLTSGTSYQFDWAYASASSSSYLYLGGTGTTGSPYPVGPAIMEVVAL